jgi:hypothetical protein
MVRPALRTLAAISVGPIWGDLCILIPESRFPDPFRRLTRPDHFVNPHGCLGRLEPMFSRMQPPEFIWLLSLASHQARCPSIVRPSGSSLLPSAASAEMMSRRGRSCRSYLDPRSGSLPQANRDFLTPSRHSSLSGHSNRLYIAGSIWFRR